MQQSVSNNRFVLGLCVQISELTSDLAEEHSTATLATERLEAETAQRMKIDKEFVDLEVHLLHFQLRLYLT